jgi:hypothetical protein
MVFLFAASVRGTEEKTAMASFSVNHGRPVLTTQRRWSWRSLRGSCGDQLRNETPDAR